MKKKHSVVLINADKSTKLWVNNTNILSYGAEAMTSSNNIGKHLYILSDDEIKEGDWCVYPGGAIKQYSGGYSIKPQGKIIATTNPELHNPYKTFGNTICLPNLPQDFIERYIKEWNKGNVIDYVLLEYEEEWYDNNRYLKVNIGGEYTLKSDSGFIEKLKLHPNNTVIIHPIEDKEAEIKFWMERHDFQLDLLNKAKEEIRILYKLLEEKKYSKEEVIKIVQNYGRKFWTNSTPEKDEVWFNENYK